MRHMETEPEEENFLEAELKSIIKYSVILSKLS